MTLDDAVAFTLDAAPWLSAILGVAGAVTGYLAFTAASAAEPPERWSGEGASFTLDQAPEIREHSDRDVLRIRTRARQAIATVLTAGAAIIAGAASGHGAWLAGLAIIVLLLSVGLSGITLYRARQQICYEQAWCCWSMWSHHRSRSRTTSQDENAAFAEEHPVEARILRRHKPE